MGACADKDVPRIVDDPLDVPSGDIIVYLQLIDIRLLHNYMI